MAHSHKDAKAGADQGDENLLALILQILDSADKPESKPRFVHEVLSRLSGLVECELITIRLGRNDDLERCQAILHSSGAYRFQNVRTAENPSSGDRGPAEEGLIPHLIPEDHWPTETFYWTEKEDRSGGLSSCGYWSDWLDAKRTGTGVKTVLASPFSYHRGLNGIIAFGFSSLDRPDQEDRYYIGQIGPFLGLSLNNWHSFASLRERVKELSCLYGLAQLLDPPGRSIEEILEGVAQLLPPAWLYAQEASARISYEGREYLSRPYHSGEQRQTAALKIHGRRTVGEVTVSYATPKPALDEGPFLAEERKLLDNVARQVGQYIERSLYETEKAEIMDKLRHADRLAMIGRLAASMAHEINEPLTSILGYAQLAEKHPDLPSQVAKDIGKVVATSLHMREIIRKTLIYARKIPPKESRLDLNEAVREALDLFGWLCHKEGIVTLFEPSDQPLPLLADPGQIRQVITNLIVNAIQAMPHSGQLRVSTNGDPQWIWFTVGDTGQGMTEDVVDKMFIPFFSTKETGRGTGLGLSVVHEIVSEQGGVIEVKTNPGQGTEIAVKFPRSPARAGEC